MGLLFILYPIAEIYAYIAFADAYGFWDAVLFTMLSGILGLFIMANQGRAALLSVQTDLAQGKNPSNRILHQLLILLGGLMIMIPGIISTIFGLLLVLPGTRHLILLLFKATLIKQMSNGRIRVFNGGAGFGGNFGGGFQQRGGFEERIERDAEVIDVTPIEVTHEKKDSE